MPSLALICKTRGSSVGLSVAVWRPVGHGDVGNDQNLWMVLGGGDVKERTFPGMI